MTRQTIFSARAESSRRSRIVLAGTLALAATLLPAAAFGMDSTPRRPAVPVGEMLSLPPIPYLDSMRWMNWQGEEPMFKVDTLLLPDAGRPGKFRLPFDGDPDLGRLS